MNNGKQKYSNLNEFLKQYKTKENDNITHTRIGDIKNGIFGGKYSIPHDKMDIFYKLYYKKVFIDKQEEYLTEVQIKNGAIEYEGNDSMSDSDYSLVDVNHTQHGQILIDFDFRYEKTVQRRQHNEGHILDIIDLYLKTIKTVFNLRDQVVIQVHVFEKPNVNILEDKTKDGIHMIIAINTPHNVQMYIRDKVLSEIDNVLEELPLINSYDNVIDDCISKGTNNWQLYGSRKPNHERYEWKQTYSYEYKEDDGSFTMEEHVSDESTYEFLKLLSARNTQQLYLEVNDETLTNIKTTVKKQPNTTSIPSNRGIMHFSYDDIIHQITNIADIKTANEMILSELKQDEYLLKETHDFTMCLSEKYYENYSEWIRVGWALHNCSFKLFMTWMEFSSKSPNFSVQDISTYYEDWKKFKYNGLTGRSIMYWAQQDNLKEFNKVRDKTIDHMISQTIDDCTEWDLAYVMFNYFKDKFRCASIKHKIWYYYKNHRWEENEMGNKFRYEISNTLSRIYSEKASEYAEKALNLSKTDTKLSDDLKKKSGNLSDIAMNLKRTGYKQNIMKEASEIFFENDPDFSNRLDKNPYLLSFNNGIYDFKEGEFRDGRPEDYVSLSTKINYVPFDNQNERHISKKEEINDFMKQLFPNDELREYMWEHLASILIGVNKPQTFNIYNGCGRNGKSKLIEFMSKCLGDYKGTVPTSLVTEKRGGVGSLTPEIAQLKGVRYAVMQEPSKGSKLNDGVMKELTGEDQIMANPKYKDPIVFIPQFKLVVCTNTLFEIKSQDDGTWRRIRLCEFQSKFVKNPNKDPLLYEYTVDVNIDKKFDSWKELFMSMLVDISKHKRGEVKDCNMVLQASNNYRKEQDYLMEFINDKLEKVPVDELNNKLKIKKTELYNEFKTWYTETYGKSIPKGKELYSFIKKKFGPKWDKEYKIKYDVDDDEDDDDDF
jgi:P4 family phage/plasmid primase-like protien